MSASKNSYSISAKHYDAAYAKLAQKQVLTDVPFYLELARQSGGPVLELGCGTGRVLLAIARAGIVIEGVDQSAAMLRVLRAHLAAEAPSARGRVKLHEADMRRFRLGRRFPLVMMPFRPLQHMYTLEDQLSALRTAAAHLQQEGRLAFDIFFPKFEVISMGVGEEILEIEWQIDGNPTKTVRRYLRKESYDKIGQTFRATFLFRTYESETLVREETEPIQMSYYTHPQITALLAMAGLEIVEQYGSFQKAPLDNQASEMIFVVKKARSKGSATRRPSRGKGRGLRGRRRRG